MGAIMGAGESRGRHLFISRVWNIELL